MRNRNGGTVSGSDGLPGIHPESDADSGGAAFVKSPLVVRAALVRVLVWSCALEGQQIRPPKTWDEADLADWATPIAALGVRPTHLPEADYYAYAWTTSGRTLCTIPAASRMDIGRCCVGPKR